MNYPDEKENSLIAYLLAVTIWVTEHYFRSLVDECSFRNSQKSIVY